MLKRLMIPMIVILLAMSACTYLQSGTPTPEPSSGIEGLVTEGPMCPGPVPVGNNPCPDRPYQTTIEVLDSEMHAVTRVESDANGYFKIPLEPGSYTLHPISGQPFPIARDQAVVVPAGEYLHVTIQYDTGMR